MMNNFQNVNFFFRIVAAIIDAIVFKMSFYLAGSTFGFEADNYWNDWWGFITALLYYALMESSSLQGSLGKVIIGLKIIRPYTPKKRISFLRAIGRNLAKYIYILVVFVSLKIVVELGNIYKPPNWVMFVRFLSILIALISCIAPVLMWLEDRPW